MRSVEVRYPNNWGYPNNGWYPNNGGYPNNGWYPMFKNERVTKSGSKLLITRESNKIWQQIANYKEEMCKSNTRSN